MDAMVLATQKYLNENYGGKPGYNNVAENGNTGWATIYALTRALQIEFGLSAPADNFGNATTAAFKQRYPNGIKEQEAGAEETSRVAIYIDAAISDIKAARQNKKIREFKENVKASKVSKALADNYTAAAYGDPDDFGYWEETAKQFREG